MYEPRERVISDLIRSSGYKLLLARVRTSRQINEKKQILFNRNIKILFPTFRCMGIAIHFRVLNFLRRLGYTLVNRSDTKLLDNSY